MSKRMFLRLADNKLALPNCINSPIGRFWMPVGIILVAMLLALYWVFAVPIFQSPDEEVHADYVFSIYSKGRLILGRDGPTSALSHPFIFYLLDATQAQRAYHRSFVKMPADYGTSKFFAKINHNQPDMRSYKNISGFPLTAVSYPFGYYALTAIWLGLLSHLDRSIVFLFFSARIFSVILLGGGLTLSYLIMRELLLPQWQSLLVLAAIGFFPLVSFVGSYIQPDNLSFFSVSLCLYLALLWRNRGKHRVIFFLGSALAFLLLTKIHCFLAAGLPILAMVFTRALYLRFSGKKLAFLFFALILPTLIAGALQAYIWWGGGLPVIDKTHCHWIPVDTEFRRVLSIGGKPLLMHIWRALCDAYQSAYWRQRETFLGFWGNFGWEDTPLIICCKDIQEILKGIIECATAIVLFLTVSSLLEVLISLRGLFLSGRWRSAFYIACSNPVINSYFLFVLFIYAYYVITFASLWLQGRYWFPVILPILLGASCFAARIFRSRLVRQKYFSVLSVSWLAYSILGSIWAPVCIHQRYFESNKMPAVNIARLISVPQTTPCCIEHCDFLDKFPTFDRHMNTLMMPAGAEMDISGWAIDEFAHSAASAVLLFVDNKQVFQPIYGLESPSAEDKFHDNKYLHSGFRMLLPTAGMTQGRHYLTTKVVSRNGCVLYNTDAALSFIVQ